MLKWLDSIRSVVTFLIILTLCFIAVWSTVSQKLVLDAKDFVSIVMIIIAFYFAMKDRPEKPPEVKP